MKQAEYSQVEVINTYLSGGTRVLKPTKARITDDSDIQEFGQELSKYLTPETESRDFKVKYCLDLGNFTYIHPNTIGELITFSNQYKDAIGEIPMMANVCPEVYEILVRAGLDQFKFDIRETIEDCLEARTEHTQ